MLNHWLELCWKGHQTSFDSIWSYGESVTLYTNPLWQLSHIHIDPKLLHIKPVKWQYITIPCSVHASFYPFRPFLSFLSSPSFLSSHWHRAKHFKTKKLPRALLPEQRAAELVKTFQTDCGSTSDLSSVLWTCCQIISFSSSWGKVWSEASVMPFSWIME